MQLENMPLLSSKITNETSNFHAKIVKETKNFAINIHLKNRENHAIEVAFYFIPISQSVAEISQLKVIILLKMVDEDYE